MEKAAQKHFRKLVEAARYNRQADEKQTWLNVVRCQDGSETTAEVNRLAERLVFWGLGTQSLRQSIKSDPDIRADLLQEARMSIWEGLLMFDGMSAGEQNAYKPDVKDRTKARQYYALGYGNTAIKRYIRQAYPSVNREVFVNLWTDEDEEGQVRVNPCYEQADPTSRLSLSAVEWLALLEEKHLTRIQIEAIKAVLSGEKAGCLDKFSRKGRENVRRIVAEAMGWMEWKVDRLRA